MRAGCGDRRGREAERMQPAAPRAAADPLRGSRAWGSLFALCVALALLGTSAAVAADKAPSWGYELAHELMSPWCPGFALPDCSSGYASELRLWILEQEKLGRPRAAVKAEILARYGEKMLQAPSAEGRGVLAYAIPAALILVGLAVLVRFLRRQGAAAAPASSADPQLLSRVDAEFAAYESTNPAE